MTLIFRFIFMFFLILIAGSNLTLPRLAESADTPQFNRRILSSASELDYPPFSIIQKDGSADGFSVELLKAVVDAVGFDINFKVGPWNEIKRELIDGQLDVLPLVSYSKERDEVLDFTAPYLRMHGAIFIRKGEKSIHSESDLKGKEVLVMKGDTAHEYAVQEHLSDHLILTNSYEDAMMQLSAGKHDAVIVQQLVGLQLIKKLKISNLVIVHSIQESSLKLIAEPLSGFEQKFCFAVKEGDKELLARLNEGLAIVITNGVYGELYDKWFGPILPKPSVSFATMLKYFSLVLIPLLILIGLAGIWYLRKEVDRKTKNLSEQIKIREAAEQSLTQTRDTLQAILDAAPAGLVFAGSTGDILLSNNFANKIFGGPITGNAKEPQDGYILSKLDGSPILNDDLPLLQALNGLTVIDMEMLVTRSDNTQSTILSSAIPLKKKNDEVWGAVAAFQDISLLKQMEEALRLLNETLEKQVAERTELVEARSRQLQALAVELIEAEERQRRQIADLLHDDLQQLLAAARMQLQAVCQTIPSQPRLNHVEHLLTEAIEKSRRLSHDLSPAVLHHAGLVETLKWLTAQMKKKFNLQVELVANENQKPASIPMKVFVFRCVQELLFNVIKHSGIKSARVVLSEAEIISILPSVTRAKGLIPEFWIHRLSRKA